MAHNFSRLSTVTFQIIQTIFSNFHIQNCKFLERLLCPIFLRQLETPKTQQQGCLKHHGDFPGSPANGMAPTPKAACFVSRWMKPHAVWMDPHGTGGSRVGRITYPIPAWKKEFLDSSRCPSLEWKTWMFPKIEGVCFPQSSMD